MNKKKFNSSCFQLFLFLMLLFSTFTTPNANAQVKEISQETNNKWIKNCALRHDYMNKLIFTATQTNNTYSWVVNDRKAYISIFEGFALDDEPKMNARRNKILKFITNSPGGNSVIISSKLSQEVDKLMEEISNKAKSFGIKCK